MRIVPNYPQLRTFSGSPSWQLVRVIGGFQWCLIGWPYTDTFGNWLSQMHAFVHRGYGSARRSSHHFLVASVCWKTASFASGFFVPRHNFRSQKRLKRSLFPAYRMGWEFGSGRNRRNHYFTVRPEVFFSVRCILSSLFCARLLQPNCLCHSYSPVGWVLSERILWKPVATINYKWIY